MKLSSIVLLLLCCSLTFGYDLSLWPRGETAYLVQNCDMPVWPQMPTEALGGDGSLVLSITMPSGFKVSSGYGESQAFAMQPRPLMVPFEICINTLSEQQVTAKVKMPSVPAKMVEDNLKYSADIEKSCRAAVLINPGNAKPGKYPVKISLQLEESGKTWELADAEFIVLPELKGKSPRRLRSEAFDYCGYANPEFKDAIKRAVLGSGINILTNMRHFEQDDTLAQLLKDQGVRPGWIMFWHNMMPVLAEKYPEVYPLDAEGNRITKPDFLLKNNICHTWCLDNREKVKDVIKEYFKENVVGRYAAVTNDNEEKAAARDRSYICGDVHTPITMDAFKEFAEIEASKELTPEIIRDNYLEEWIDFRCWQSAQMSSLMSEAIAEIDPTIEYGYYSGHKYVGNLAGFSKAMYATDWDLLAKEGGIYYGSSGYYGSTKDYAATTEALGSIPHIPAEMFIENFLDFKKDMPTPEQFSYRLMKSLMYGSGGFAVWYLQVLDGAGYYAVSEVSAIAAEIEDYILDGEDCSDELILPFGLDKDAVFAYKLGQKRMVAVFNHSARQKNIRIGWKEAISKPDTVEIVTGRNLADSKFMAAELEPRSYAVFVTLSQGN
ncbi:hypothetical protein SMSP2_02136 [Limihaloglobus sulfuriphilus]|uniref:Glycoside hydrolase family 42 N-terminal domain-containing protein n=1 Tax=Limihaloglobus sulfuriphilus TaxID=1851148 RepID=A0A1Q2MGU7_9BACT|nr:hypothetical protein [Limihaloglobus sulfuriphilus]AQQ71758.1 hypothetical protein SMSP2_02136 [Limihaloglobus sulfuriphilus]